MMRDAHWEAMFSPRREAERDDAEERRPWLVAPWEDWMVLGLLAAAYLSVAHAINLAHWAEGMPSLVPVGLAGLAMAFAMSRLRLPGVAVHLLALPAGLGVVFAQVLAVAEGSTPGDRWNDLYSRMDIWLHALFRGGASSDELPFIALVVLGTWGGAYASSWTLFRWRNVWLAVAPGGVAVFANVSALPGDFSFAAVVYLFFALLLLAAMNVRERAVVWERDGVEYPEFLNLSAVGVVIVPTVALLTAAWLLPLPGRASPLAGVWEWATSPVTERLEPYGRVFLGVSSKKALPVHRFGDLLPLRGRIELSSRAVAEIAATELPPAPYLRARVYGEYSAEGWRMTPLTEAAVEADAAPDGVEAAGRATHEITVTLERGQEVLFSLGQPIAAGRESVADLGADDSDVLAIKPAGALAPGTTYSVTGSASVATAQELRAAGGAYPGWAQAYVELPEDLPARVRELAVGIASSEDNAYDRAAAIEAYLRTLPVDLEIDSPPAGQDPVDYFLFGARRGYFDYHASAMAVLLRSLGVPARVAVGYAIGAGDRDGDVFRISERRAFAWTEVYFPSYGWVEFNPTPSEPSIRRPGSEEDALDRAGGGLAGMDDIPVAGGAFPLFPEEPPGPIVIEGTGEGRDLRAWYALAAGAGACVLAIVAGWWGWNRGMARLQPASRAWAKAARLAAWAGAPPDATQTPREYASALVRRFDGVEPVRDIAAAYERARYAGPRGPDDEADAAVEAAWRAVRVRLLRRALRLL